MKRLLVLLVLLAGGLIAAALSVPSDAAVVNGAAISQQSLNGDVGAIANSAYYQCYLNSRTFLTSSGSSQLPPVVGAGVGQNQGDHPTATSAFAAYYLDTEIGYQLVDQLAAQRGVTPTPAQLTQARRTLTQQISQVMSAILQTAEGGNPRYACGATTKPLTGQQVLATMPASFVDQQIADVATSTALQAELVGVGSHPSDLRRYYEAHRAEFDTVCFDAAVFTSKSAAKSAAAAVTFGTPFSQVASQAVQSGSISCAPITTVASELGVPVGELRSVSVGGLTAPLSFRGSYVIAQLTKRTPTPYVEAQSAVSAAVQRAGSAVAQRVLLAAGRHASVSVNPQYGSWVPSRATVFPPVPPGPSDVLNVSANRAGTSQLSASPSGG